MPGEQDRKGLDRTTRGNRLRVVQPAADTAAALNEGTNEAFVVVTPVAVPLVQTLPPIEGAGGVGAGYSFIIKNVGGMAVELTPSGTDLVEGITPSPVAGGGSFLLISTIVAGAPNEWRRI